MIRPLSFRIFERSFSDGVSPIDDGDPYKIFRREEGTVQDLFLKKALDLAETGIPSRTMGMSLMDLLNCDPATFEQIDNTCTSILENKNKAVSEFQNEMDE